VEKIKEMNLVETLETNIIYLQKNRLVAAKKTDKDNIPNSYPN